MMNNQNKDNIFLITYDIKEQDYDKYNDLYKKFHEYSNYIHLQNSVWIIKTKKTSTVILKELVNIIPNSLISVSYINSKYPKYNKIYTDDKDKTTDYSSLFAGTEI